ncbi:DUF4381 domain-containing protein [Endothiovibrio diazotrophicus]
MSASAPLPATPALPPQALEGLRDIHLPPPVSWWPPAPGWWLLVGLTFALLLALGWWWRATRLRRAALRELKRLRARYADEPSRFAAELSILLRRCALARFPREAAAGCVGEAWLQFLDRSGGGDAFTRGAGRSLVTAPYRPQELVEVAALAAVAERWVKRAMGGRRRV